MKPKDIWMLQEERTQKCCWKVGSINLAMNSIAGHSTNPLQRDRRRFSQETFVGIS
jgi:hypothetical protein